MTGADPDILNTGIQIVDDQEINGNAGACFEKSDRFQSP